MDYIEIKGYKSIKDAKVDIAPINILIGANGSGKSNFVSFFDFLNKLYNRSLGEYIALKGGEDKILFHGRKVTDTLSFEISFENGINAYSVELKSGDNGFVFKKEDLIYRGNHKDIGFYGQEACIKTTDAYRAKWIIEYLEGFRKYHFHDTGSNSPFTKYSNIDTDISYFYRNGENIAAFMYNIKKTAGIIYNRIITNIQSVAPYFSDFYFDPNRNPNLKLLWKDKFSDTLYGTNDLSDGTLRFIALAVLFLQPHLPRTIIIDEPELGLHPFAISKLAGMIKSASERGCQIIVATQSTDLISHFEPEDIITVDQINGESKFRRLSRESLQIWLDNYYTIDDLWKRNIIEGGQPNYNL
ncbi:MAG: AAA family ATPase [Porphyromonas sp.]|nr:AAA family ATPase [Porphyromonas sp.]